MSIYTPRAATKREAKKLREHGFFGWDNAADGLHGSWCNDQIDGVFTTGMALEAIRNEWVAAVVPGAPADGNT